MTEALWWDAGGTVQAGRVDMAVRSAEGAIKAEENGTTLAER